MTKIITRFAPSPTGKLHIGNVRTAIVNYLYTKKKGGEFVLRIDDTDKDRSTEGYEKGIIDDLNWLGIKWDAIYKQSERFNRYNEVKDQFIASGKLYACYETSDELAEKRKKQLAKGMPPKYDRASLNLSEEQIKQYELEGRKPHYRFLLEDQEISWNDKIKGELKYHARNLSDPVLIREDGSITYMFCSVIDDVDFNISIIIRGEDHVSNTAVQLQLFKAIGRGSPEFAHLSLMKAKNEKISKREGGFEISELCNDGLEPMAVNSFLALIGTPNIHTSCKNMEELIDIFDISNYSKTPTTYMQEELDIVNAKLVMSYEYSDIKNYLEDNHLIGLDEKFWQVVRPNIKKMSDLKEWWQVYSSPQQVDDLDEELLNVAIQELPKEINENSWNEWTKSISKITGKKGKELFLPLRLALTGKISGPELKTFLTLFAHDEIITRLKK